MVRQTRNVGGGNREREGEHTIEKQNIPRAQSHSKKKVCSKFSSWKHELAKIIAEKCVTLT